MRWDPRQFARQLDSFNIIVRVVKGCIQDVYRSFRSSVPEKKRAEVSAKLRNFEPNQNPALRILTQRNWIANVSFFRGLIGCHSATSVSFS